MNRLLTILLIFTAFSTFVFSSEIDDSSSDKYDIYYKNGKVVGSLEKISPAKVDLRSIFTLDLRNDADFRRAIDNSIMFYSNIIDSDVTFRYGDVEYTPMEMINSLVKFKDLINKNMDYISFLGELGTSFDVYETKNHNNKAILTGYYTPHVEVSSKRSGDYLYPIVIQGFSDGAPQLFSKNKDDIYNLKLEGAGIVEMYNGLTFNIEYAGRKHIGKKIVKIIKTKKKIKLAHGKKGTKVAYVKRVIVNSTPYFRVTDGGPYGWADVPLTPKYTAAIDRDLAPMGGLMYIKSTQKTENVDSVLNVRPEFSEFEGFMLAQDIGSAIKGPGRVDVYCGDSLFSRKDANSISRVGSVYLIVAKKETIDEKIDRRVELR